MFQVSIFEYKTELDKLVEKPGDTWPEDFIMLTCAAFATAGKRKYEVCLLAVRALRKVV